MAVRNILGYPSTDLGTLCQCDKVNKYSRFRPGYWYVDTSGNLAFQRPQGGGYNDPRGADTNGISVQAYKLGDFRGYNHDAASPSLNTGSDLYEVTLASGQGGKNVNVEVVFNLGEVDWFGDETQYHGRNNITGAYDTIYAARKTGTTGFVIVGSCNKNDLEKSGYQARAPITVSLFANASGTTAYTLIFGLGYAGKAYAWFPEELTLKLTVLSGAIIIVRVLPEALVGLKSKLSLTPLDSSNISQILVYGGEISYTSAVISATFTNLSFIARMASGNEYMFTALRLAATGTVYCYSGPYNASGSVLKSQQDFNGLMAASGQGTYNFGVSLPETANDGEYFYVDIKEFTTGTISAVQI